MSQIDVHAGALLEMLTRTLAARRVLQIGTASGSTTLQIVNGLSDDGMLIALERDNERALSARAALERAGVAQRASVMIGDAARYLHKIAGPFDLIVQHAEADERELLRPRLLQLLRSGGVLATTVKTADGDVVLMIKR